MNPAMAALRSSLNRRIRDFFDGAGYLEVETPSLAAVPIPEPTIELFRTEALGLSATDPFGSRSSAATAGPSELFLLPSPELYLKRAVAETRRSIYEISRAFRNMETVGRLHEVEFTMLEWYSWGSDYRDTLDETLRLLTALGDLGDTSASFAQALRSAPLILPMSEAFDAACGLRLGPGTTGAELTEAVARAGAGADGAGPPRPQESREDLFHRLLVDRVEPSLPRDRPVFLTDWPAWVPTLARTSPRTGMAERWELYVDGIELANAYTEEFRPERVRAYLREEGRRKQSCRVPHPVDDSFADLFATPGEAADARNGPSGDTGAFAQHSGGDGETPVPTCSGVALGVDRLLMLLAGAQSIQGVMNFPLSGILP